MKKNIGLLILTIFTILFVAGCAKQGDNIDKEQTKEQPDEQIDEQPKVEEVVNNGGLYVGYKELVFYRQYTTDSYVPTGIFGSYDAVPEAPKNMMYVDQDGTSQIAFSDTGVGEIYICNNRMYLGKLNEDLLPTIYAVDLDGSNEVEIGTGWIKGIDEVTGTLICILENEKNTYQLYRLDGITGEIKEYDLAVSCSEFLALKDGVIFYSGEVEYETSILGEMILCSVNIDGSNEVVLAHTDPDLYEFGDRGTIVPCIQFVGDTIYFSYGAYGGTGNFYQGGKIAKVQKDGSELTILLGMANEEAEFNDTLVGDIFYVSSDHGNEILYYSQVSENQESFSYNLSSGEIEVTDFVIHAEGDPFKYEGGVSVYLHASPIMTTLIPEVKYQYLELEEEADYNTINDVEICGNWVYYRIEANKEDSTASIGWREGYQRVKTKVIREQLEGDTVEILFEY